MSTRAEVRLHPAWPTSSGREFIKQLGRWSTGLLGSGLSSLFGSAAGERVGILMYHRIAEPSPAGVSAPTWNVTPRRFRAQLRGLLQRRYVPASLRTILDARRTGQPVPAGSFVVTFDDGYENVYTHAWPVLRDLGVPATVFLATTYLDGDGPFPFDDWQAAGSSAVPHESWRPLTTAQCMEMYASGLVDLGSHTHTHAVFRGRPEAFRQDLASSLEVLRRRFGLSEAAFAFPFGIADADMVAVARQSGALAALTTQGDLVRPGSDPFTWGRLNVDDADTPATLAAKLDGWYSLARCAWLRWRGHRVGLGHSLGTEATR